MSTTSFSLQIGYLNRGTLNDELTEALAEVVKSVRETGKTGSLSLQLKVSMLNKRDENAIKITPVVKTSIPELDRADTIMWSTHDGDLLRNDPHQPELELRVIPTATEEKEPIKLANG